MDFSEEQIIQRLNRRNFSCQRCSRCCRKEPGIVMLTKEDVDRAANRLKLPQETFLEQYCREIYRDGIVFAGLKEKKNYDCIFWQDSGCLIYEVRPLQCETFPFWPYLVESDLAWEQEKRRCPGLDKSGTLSFEEKFAFYRQEKRAIYLRLR